MAAAVILLASTASCTGRRTAVPTELTASNLPHMVGREVRVRGKAEKDKDGAYVLTPFYSLKLSDQDDWSPDLVGRTVIVTGRLGRREPRGVEEFNESEQSRGPAANMAPTYFLSETSVRQAGASN